MQTSGSIIAGIRPEKVVAVPLGVEPIEKSLGWSRTTEADVLSATYSGAATEYTVRVQDGTVFEVFAQNLRAGGLQPGTRVELWWDDRNVFGLSGDADTEAGVEADS